MYRSLIKLFCVKYVEKAQIVKRWKFNYQTKTFTKSVKCDYFELNLIILNLKHTTLLENVVCMVRNLLMNYGEIGSH